MSLQMLVLHFLLQFTNVKEKLNIFMLKICDKNVPLGIVCLTTNGVCVWDKNWNLDAYDVYCWLQKKQFLLPILAVLGYFMLGNWIGSCFIVFLERSNPFIF